MPTRFAVAALLAVVALPLSAGVHIWRGGASALFSSALNWEGGSPAGDDAAELSFPGGARLVATNDLADLKVRSIEITGEGMKLAGNRITLVNGEIVNFGKNVIANDLVLDGDLAISSFATTFGSRPTADLALSGALTGSGGVRVRRGIVVFSGNAPNDYRGVTEVVAGELQLMKTAGVTGIPGPVHVTGSGFNYEYGTLAIFANEQIADDAPVTVDGRATLETAATETLGPLTLASSVTVHSWAGWDGRQPIFGELILSGDVTTLPDHQDGDSVMSGFYGLAGSRTISAAGTLCCRG